MIATATTHYHVLSGDHGYLPDSNTAYETRDDAQSGLEWFVEGIFDSGDVPDSAVTYSRDLDYVTFESGYGIGAEYAEITECSESDCYDESRAGALG